MAFKKPLNNQNIEILIQSIKNKSEIKLNLFRTIDSLQGKQLIQIYQMLMERIKEIIKLQLSI